MDKNYFLRLCVSASLRAKRIILAQSRKVLRTRREEESQVILKADGKIIINKRCSPALGGLMAKERAKAPNS